MSDELTTTDKKYKDIVPIFTEEMAITRGADSRSMLRLGLETFQVKPAVKSTNSLLTVSLAFCQINRNVTCNAMYVVYTILMS